ncbi:hypothetical protein [Gottfriedia solisilvae]|uniref:hypothetical protein n=1 Tax=Gottfriedia solisilvae TaxID=1516104 RepID=UPI003D2EAD87
MDSLFGMLMTFWFTIILIFQPYLNQIEDARDTITQVAIQRGVEKAAVDGEFTPENINEMTTLLKAVGYKETDIEYELTQGVKLRGEYISGKITVPDQYSFILISKILEQNKTQDDMYHVKAATRMSEFLN